MERFSKFITILIVVECILGQYKSIVPNLALLEATQLLCLLYVLLYAIKNGELYFESSTFVLVVLIGANFIIHLIISDYIDAVDYMGSTLRYLFHIVMLSFVCYKYFDYHLGVKAIQYLSVITSLYIIFQLFLSIITGIKLPGGLPFLHPIREEMRTYIDDVNQYGLIYRPRSLFAEPAHYCQFTVIPLILVMFSEKRISRTNLYVALLHSVGILCSMSMLGIIVMVCVWILFFWERRNEKRAFFTILISVPVFILILLRVPFIYKRVIERFQNGLMTDIRLNSILYYNTLFENIGYALFGHGIADIGQFLPSYLRWIYFFGAFGGAVLLGFFMYNFRRATEIGKKMIAIFMIICIGSELLLGGSFKTWFSFVLSNYYMTTRIAFDNKLDRMDRKKSTISQIIQSS